jgi:LPS sulfotransferase NodH
LCEGLDQSGVAGRPQEYAPEEDEITWREFHGCASHREYFDRYLDLGRTPNGAFGAKLMWWQFVAWVNDARRYRGLVGPPAAVVRSLVGPFVVIRLVRHDRVRQAISWVRARSTGQWGQPEGEIASEPDLPDSGYDPEVLAEAVRALGRQQEHWDGGLAKLGAPLLTLAYEDLARDYPAVVRRALEFTGAPAGADPPPPRRRRQADATSDEWARRAARDLPRELLAAGR